MPVTKTTVSLDFSTAVEIRERDYNESTANDEKQKPQYI